MPGPPVGVQGRHRLAETAERVVKLYAAWGRPEKAVEWREKIGAFPPTVPKPWRQLDLRGKDLRAYSAAPETSQSVTAGTTRVVFPRPC